MTIKVLSQISYVAMVLLNAGTFILFLQTWRLCSDNFDRLPDRIPIHFGLSGKADGWARKSRFSVYWLPVSIAIIWVLMLMPVVIAMAQSGSESIPLLVFFSLISFAIAVMFYNIARGIIDYALGRAVSIWPYMAKPLIFVIVSSFATPLLPFLMILQKPVLKEAFTSDAAWTAKYRPAPKLDFGPADKRVFLNTRFADLNGKPDVEARWYTPQGKLAFNYRYDRPYRDIKTQRILWNYIDLDHFRKEGVRPGKWKVIVFRKNKQLRKLQFTVR